MQALWSAFVVYIALLYTRPQFELWELILCSAQFIDGRIEVHRITCLELVFDSRIFYFRTWIYAILLVIHLYDYTHTYTHTHNYHYNFRINIPVTGMRRITYHGGVPKGSLFWLYRTHRLTCVMGKALKDLTSEQFPVSLLHIKIWGASGNWKD